MIKNALLVILFIGGQIIASEPVEAPSQNVELNLQGNKVLIQVQQNVSKLPFYFPEGVVTETKNKALQWQEYLRYAVATQKKHQNYTAPQVVGGNTIEFQTDVISTSKWAPDSASEAPRTMRLVLDGFVRLPDGRVRVTFAGEQKIISEKELEIVKNDMLKMVDEAAEYNFQYFKDYVDLAVTARAKAIGISKEEFVGFMDEKIDNTQVTYRELNSLPPDCQKSDFVPLELHLGPTPRANGVLGLTLLNSGIVWYNPQARVIDYLMGRPLILMHEMVHVNNNLQNYPLANYFDPELMAMVPEGLLENTQLYIFNHHYLEELRKMAWVYFGFDFDEARQRFIRYDLLGNIYIDEQEFNRYHAMAAQIQAETLKFFREKAIPEFYASPVYWMAFNKKMNNGNAWLWVVFSKHYEPTILGGHKNTRVWLDSREREIKEMAANAYKKSGHPMGGAVLQAEGENLEPPKFLLDKYYRLFNASERQKIEGYFREHPEDLQKLLKMDLEQAYQLAKKIGRGER